MVSMKLFSILIFLLHDLRSITVADIVLDTCSTNDELCVRNSDNRISDSAFVKTDQLEKSKVEAETSCSQHDGCCISRESDVSSIASVDVIFDKAVEDDETSTISELLKVYVSAY